MRQDTGRLRIRFESKHDGTWWPLLASPKDGLSPIATQNAGSSSAAMYYQVDGGGVNGQFSAALRTAKQLDATNARLRSAYAEVFGAGEWAKDRAAHRTDRLTSLLVPLLPDGETIEDGVHAMVYSVGPILDATGITDQDGYRQIYYDAYEQIARFNRQRQDPLVGLRLTMVSTGIYAQSVIDVAKLFTTAAHNIVVGVAQAVAHYGTPPAGFTLLVNANLNNSPWNEKLAFDAGLAALDMSAEDGVYTIDVARQAR